MADPHAGLLLAAAWSYRGPLAIHAGQRWSDRGAHSPLIADLYLDTLAEQGWRPARGRDAARPSYVQQGIPRLVDAQFGAIIGTVDLVDVHPQHDGCCTSPWAETSYVEHGGRQRRQLVHLVLEQARPLDEPIPCVGRLGLWTPPTDVLNQLPEVA